MAPDEVMSSMSTSSLPEASSTQPTPPTPTSRFSAFLSRFTRGTEDALPLLELVKNMRATMEIMDANQKEMRSELRAVSDKLTELERGHAELLRENSELKKKILSIPSPPPTSPLSSQSLPVHASTASTILSPRKMIMERSESGVRDIVESVERARAVVIYGLPEFASWSPTQRARNDRGLVLDVLNHLGVQGVPTAVFRMPVGGAPDPKGRLTKVILPCSKLQEQTISRRHLLASFKQGRVWMRPSLTSEERASSTDRPFTYNLPGKSGSSATKRPKSAWNRGDIGLGDSRARVPFQDVRTRYPRLDRTQNSVSSSSYGRPPPSIHNTPPPTPF